MIATLLILLVPRSAGAQDDLARAQLEEQLSYLDGDSGLVLSIQIDKLQTLQEQAALAFPAQKGSIDMAALGAIAILGFHPLQTRAWSAVGLDPEARIVAQLATISRKEANAADAGGALALWRTRLVLRASDPQLARTSLGRMRLRDRVRLADGEDSDLGELLGIAANQVSAARTKLDKAGVVMLARPAPLKGLVVVSQRGSIVLLDLLIPYSPSSEAIRWKRHEALLLRSIARQPGALDLEMPGAEVLSDNHLGLWLRPTELGNALSASELDGRPRDSAVRRHARCEPFRELAAQSSFQSLSAGLDISERALSADLRWHLQEQSDLQPLLSQSAAPFFRREGAIVQGSLRLDRIGGLRGRPRAPVAASWDLLWRKAQACGRGSKVFAIAVAWPEIAGLFLDELSVLHPSASLLIDGLGSASVTADVRKGKAQLLTEAWVRAPADAIAKSWLKALFGGEKRKGATTRWGQGLMRPYAISDSQGSIIGTGFRPGSRERALKSGLNSELRNAPSSDELLILRASPARLQELWSELPLQTLLARWAAAEGRFSLSEGTLHFKLQVDQI